VLKLRSKYNCTGRSIKKAILEKEWLSCLNLNMRFYFLIIIVAVSFGCSSKTYISGLRREAIECHKSWQYFKLEKPVKGIVLSQTTGFCGYVMAPWAVVIRTTDGDTIRVLELCSRLKLAKLDSIIVNISKDSLVKDVIINTEYDCKIKRTCSGLITRIDRRGPF
jgi:hypothetical protein